jgi:hypothetical protein
MELVRAHSIEALLGRRPSGREAEVAPNIILWEGPLGPAAARTALRLGRPVLVWKDAFEDPGAD